MSRGLITFVLFMISLAATGSDFRELCRVTGKILDHPSQDKDGAICFTYRIEQSEGRSSGGMIPGVASCDRHIGNQSLVCIPGEYLGKLEYRKGAERVLVRDVRDFDIKGRVFRLISFEAEDIGSPRSW